MSKLASAAAPVLFVLLWSTGFIGAKYGLPYVEPLTFLGVRMIFVVIILAGMALLVGARWPRHRAIGHSIVAGSLVHGTYLGGVFIAISQGVPAGISALIPGLQPVLTSTLAGRFMGEKVTPLQWLGLALGLVGVLLVTAASWAAAGSAGPLACSRCSASPSARFIRSAIAAISTGAPAIWCNMWRPASCSGSAPSLSRRARSIGPVNSSSHWAGGWWGSRLGA